MSANLAIRQAQTDSQLVDLWLAGRSPHTQAAYLRDVGRLLACTNSKGLAQITLGDLQAWANTLTDLAPASQARAVAAVKSLFSFATRIGYLRMNPAAALRLPARKETLAERILPEEDVVRMIALEHNRRNRVLLKMLYVAGLRVSEACGLRWRDLVSVGDRGQVTVFGKGGKTRIVPIPRELWKEIQPIRPPEADGDDPVFVSRRGGMLDDSQVLRIVRKAAGLAGIVGKVSPHWLRHAHATHALERGAPLPVVQETLGHASITTTRRYLHVRPGVGSSLWLG